jgi:hypothetical protein
MHSTWESDFLIGFPVASYKLVCFNDFLNLNLNRFNHEMYTICYPSLGEESLWVDIYFLRGVYYPFYNRKSHGACNLNASELFPFVTYTPPVIAGKFQFHVVRSAVRCVINKLTVKLDIRRQQQDKGRVFIGSARNKGRSSRCSVCANFIDCCKSQHRLHRAYNFLAIFCRPSDLLRSRTRAPHRIN